MAISMSHSNELDVSDKSGLRGQKRVPNEDRDLDDSAGSPPILIRDTDEEDKGENEEDELGKLICSDGERLLAFVDGLRKIDALHDVRLDLPQLVVVGNTSSGKSSLLQAITKLPFPVSQDLCTHFATETEIRRCRPSEKPGYKIMVKPASMGEREVLDFKPIEYRNDDWRNVYRQLKDDIRKAFERMRPTKSAGDDTGRKRNTFKENKRATANPQPQFREDIMTVEVVKPDQAHFSIVDVPGLASNGAPQDIQLSENLARRYISNPRAITLAVISAIDAINNQKVLSLVREADAISRTIGVITECDRVESRDEAKVLDLLRNEQASQDYLPIGWFAIKNRSTREVEKEFEKETSFEKSLSERDSNETDFFSKDWRAGIDRKVIGINKLREQLARSLYKQVRGSFPDLRNQMRSTHKELKTELDLLGEPRNSAQLQRHYLLKLQRQYQDLATQWLTGRYKRGCPTNDPSKLRYHVEHLHDDFNKKLRASGKKYTFRSPGDEAKGRAMYTDQSWKEDMRKADDVYSWILRAWDALRGSEPRLDPPHYLKQHLFDEQTADWEEFASDYLNRVIHQIESCNVVLFEDSCSDAVTRQKIRHSLEAAETTAVCRAEKELQAIIRDNSQLRTYSPYFDFEKKNSERLRIKTTVEGFYPRIKDGTVQNSEEIMYTLDASADMSHEVFEIHDWLRAYVEIAMFRFIDNVVIQVVERHLLGANGPVGVFDLEWVNSLSEDELDALVGEDEETKRKRSLLQEKVEALDKELKKADGLARC